MAVESVAVRTNPKLRESRLYASMFGYLKRSVATLVRIFAMYEPLKVFTYIGAVLMGLGLIISLRFIYFYMTRGGAGHVQSLILSAIFLLLGFQIMVAGLYADIIAANRRLLEEALYKIRKCEMQLNAAGVRERDPRTR